MILGTLRSIRRRLSGEHEFANVRAGTQTAAWYDWTYRGTPEYHGHYCDSSYYFLWTVIADRLTRQRYGKVLDLACGPGQFASLLYDKGVRQYRGIDFSPVCIEMAHRRQIPQFEFMLADLANEDALSGIEYDCVVTMEFLEHVEFDLSVLSRLKPGVRVLATVPNFPYTSHVRHFRDADEVTERYAAVFSSLTVDTFLENAKGKTFFLMEGIKA